ncbi:GNAT family N-acetyltransferase [Undibacterium sp. TS12]|uniref:GNAT family N-acetyltransferase n=1 Tax=Undibacterium sp. TS12 TaxID=2908202 RepID=UPI001F4C763E|nr:GNAT family N-acetyltransferase [Undibacterium sp. TS12]MCH8620338.1 GNAT family N-acetyltransferase [Undibacterium sp. TS12]
MNASPEHNGYRAEHRIPDVATYCQMRVSAGLSAKTAEAAARGLPASLFAVQIMQGEKTVGMGRVIGDGGTAYQVVDIAVLPQHQGKGLGKMIMHEITHYLQQQAPASAYVSLMADGQAQDLYAQFGFKHTAPASVGMAYKV